MSEPEQQAVDLNWKMNKKIAQLTKVIYQLNCRNEDSDTSLRNLAGTYESEIADIMSDARGKITTLKDALNSKRDETKAQEIVAAMTRQHQTEKAAALKQFDDYKQKAAQSEATVKRAVEERLTGLTQELTGAKEAFESKLRSIATHSQADADGAAGDLAAKNAEINDLVISYNDKYKAMLAEQMAEQDRLEKTLNAEWGEKLTAEEDAHHATSVKLSEEICAEKTKAVAAVKDGDSLRDKLRAAEVTISQRGNDVHRLEEKVASLHDRLSAMANEAEGAARDGVSQSDIISALRAQVAVLKGDQEEKNASITALTDTNAKRNTQITDLENDIAVLTADAQKLRVQIADRDAEAAALAQQGGDTASALSAAQGDLRDAHRQLELAIGKCASLDNDVSELRTQKSNLVDDVAYLKQKHSDDTTASNAEHQAALEALRSQLAEQQQGSATEVAARHRAALEAARADAEKDREWALSEAKAASEIQQAALDAKHAAAITELHADHAAVVLAFEKRIAVLQAELLALRSTLDGDAKARAAASADGDRAITDLRATLLQTEKDAAAAAVKATSTAEDTKQLFDAKLASLQEQLSTSEKESARVTAALVAAEKAAAKSQKQLADAEDRRVAESEAHAVEMDRQRKAFETSASMQGGERDKAARDELQRRLDELREKLALEHVTATAALTEKHDVAVHGLKTESAALASNINKLEVLVSKLQADMAAATDAHEQATLVLRDELQAQRERSATEAAGSGEKAAQTLAKLQEQLRSEQAARGKAATDHESVLLMLKAEHASAVASASSAAQVATDAAAATHAQELADLTAQKDNEHRAATASLAEKYAATETELSAKHQQEMEQQNMARAALERELRAEMRARETADGSVKRLEGEVDRLVRDVDAERNASRDATAQGADDVRLEAERGASAKAAALAALKAEHEAHMEALNLHFTAQKDDMQAKAKQMQRLIADLEYKIANRESRTEDVAKINELLKACRDKDDALLKAYNDMKQYKLELMNKETTYNKVFGRQPTLDADGSAGPNAPAPAPAPAPSSTKSRHSIAATSVNRRPSNMK
jgi:chromosome segregation ATPase